MLLTYPQSVVEQATDPVEGIPARVKFLNLAEIKTLLDGWRVEYLKHLERVERASRLRIAVEPDNPEMRERVRQGLVELAQRLKATA